MKCSISSRGFLIYEMKFRRQIASILMFALAFVILTVKLEAGYSVFILKGLTIGLLTAILYKFAFSQDKPKAQTTEIESQAKDSAMSLPLSEGVIQDHYQSLIKSVLNAIKAIQLDYESCVYIHDAASDGYTLQASTGSDFKDFIKSENEMVATIIQSKTVQNIRRQDNIGGWEEIFSERTWRGSETVIGIPLMYKNVRAGCLIVLVEHFSSIQERDSLILTEMTNFISRGMEDLENLEQLRVESYFQARITNLFDSLEVRSDISELAESIQGLCRAFFQYDKLTIALKENHGPKAKIILVDGMQEDAVAETEFNIEHCIHGLAMHQNNIIRSNSWAAEYPGMNRFREGDRDEYNFMSILSIPIQLNGIPMGVISLERVKSKLYSLTDQHLLEILANTMGSILSWQDAYKQMHLNAIHDGLTGLLNHKAFMERFEEEVSRASRFDHNLVLIVLDLDKFKSINDNYGHLYGDFVLKEVANLIKLSVRTIDVVGRYGGEEFSVVLVNTDISHSLPVAKRIVENISNFVFEKEGIKVQMTISAGLAGFPGDADEMRALIANADKAMYKTKQHGGNAVTVYEKSVKTPSG